MLLSRSLFAARTNNKSFLDQAAYPDAYLNALFATAEADIASVLQYQPSLQLVGPETGIAELVLGGKMVGRYFFELNSFPLPGDDATLIFQNLSLKYALAEEVPTQVNLNLTKVDPSTGQTMCLAPGGVEALAGVQSVTFGFAPAFNAVSALWYSAVYWAGYLTGNNDPVPNGGGTGFACHAVLGPNGNVASIVVDNPGTNYTNPPVLIVTPTGGGSGCSLSPQLVSGAIPRVDVPNGGFNYNSAPTIAVSTLGAFPVPQVPPSLVDMAQMAAQERILVDSALLNGQAIPSVFAQQVRTLDMETRLPPLAQLPGATGMVGLGTVLTKTMAHKLDQWRRKNPIKFV